MSQFNQVNQNMDRFQRYDTDGVTNYQIDWFKLRLILKKSLPWFGIIFGVCLTISILYLRYTKPMYQSSSEIKLDKENKSYSFGFSQREQSSNFELMSSEIELIRSRLFFNKVIETVPLNPQYFIYGKILVDERYLNPPFFVDYSILNSKIYNIPISVKIINKKSYELSYTINKQEFSFKGQFGNLLKTSQLKCTLTLNKPFNIKNSDNFFFFKINSREALINYIEKNLVVEPLNLEANTFKISFTDHNLHKAHALVSAIDTIYYNYSLQEKTKANRSKISYLNIQLEEVEKKLNNFETYFENFTINNKTVDLSKDLAQTVDAINGLDSAKIRINLRLKELDQLQKTLTHISYKNLTPKTDIYPIHLNKTLEEFNLLNNELQKLALSYKENTYTFKSRKKEVELIRGDILSKITDFKQDLLIQKNNLETNKQRLRGQLISLPSKNTEYNNTKRFYTLYEEMYISLTQKKNEFEIEIAGSTTKIKILSPASLLNEAIYPVPLFVYISAIILSIIFSLMLMGVFYLIHNKIQSLREIELLTQATILGAVPKHNLNSAGFAKIIVNKHPKSAVSEALRSIRTNIEFMLPEKRSRVISITSTIGSEGKTFISTNLATLLAMAGKKTVIIDLDLRKPKIHLAFEQKENLIGVSSILIGKKTIKECLFSSSIEGLSFITAGPIPPNPSELILRDEFNQLVEDLKKTYDMVILDTPPVGLVTDGLLAMQKADLPIYVLKADFSKKVFVQNINRILASRKFNNLSLILNATTASDSGYGYGYGKKSAYYES